MKTLSYLALVALSLFSALSLAQSTEIADKFKKFDRNNDGFLTRSETAVDPALWSRFSSYDKDKDGQLTLTEYGIYASK
ncbi:EF-hand domain-containing protein [Pseudoalteromonas espejiana]